MTPGIYGNQLARTWGRVSLPASLRFLEYQNCERMSLKAAGVTSRHRYAINPGAPWGYLRLDQKNVIL